MEHQTVYLSLGSNLGQRTSYLQEARRMIASQCGSVVRTSSVYETAAWGFQSEQSFLNQVVCVQTNDSPHQLLEKLMGIETDQGRFRDTADGYTSRTLDIDILFYNQQIVLDPQLTIPHPKLHLRKFVLVPLCEIAPDLVHPQFQQTMQQLLQRLNDPLSVELFDTFANP